MIESCENCKFWDPPPPNGDLDPGKCRRSPPVLLRIEVIGMGQAEPEDYWSKQTIHDMAADSLLWSQPPTQGDEWCGEWKLKAPADASPPEPA